MLDEQKMALDNLLLDVCTQTTTAAWARPLLQC